MADKKLYSAKEAAEYCGISYKHMRNITAAGQITHYNGGTDKMPKYKYKKAWLDEYKAERLGRVVKAQPRAEELG